MPLFNTRFGSCISPWSRKTSHTCRPWNEANWERNRLDVWFLGLDYFLCSLFQAAEVNDDNNGEEDGDGDDNEGDEEDGDINYCSVPKDYGEQSLCADAPLRSLTSCCCISRATIMELPPLHPMAISMATQLPCCQVGHWEIPRVWCTQTTRRSQWESGRGAIQQKESGMAQRVGETFAAQMPIRLEGYCRTRCRRRGWEGGQRCT